VLGHGIVYSKKAAAIGSADLGIAGRFVCPDASGGWSMS
jgi:hypothetical protein